MSSSNGAPVRPVAVLYRFLLSAHSHNTVSLPVWAYYPRLRPEDPSGSGYPSGSITSKLPSDSPEGVSTPASHFHTGPDTDSPSLTWTPQGTGALVPRTVSLHPGPSTPSHSGL